MAYLEELDLELSDDRFYRWKKTVDRLLPFALAALGIYLYLEFLAPVSDPLQEYSVLLQFSVLSYFVLELLLDFLLYERHSEFFRDRWFDIVLTLPFFSALKAFKGLRVLKLAKIGKTLKSVKLMQKVSKLFLKSKKILKGEKSS